MPSLEIISVNLWQILISLCNLLIMFLLLKKFLYKPVRKVLAQRQKALDEQYAAAAKAQQEVDDSKAAWDRQMADAEEQAAAILRDAKAAADRHSTQLLDDAREKADTILRQAEADAALEKKKAESSVKQEIVDVSALLTAKLLEREIKPADHRALIDSFIDEIDDKR